MSVEYDVFDDPYCYKGTQTLKNKLGLRDPLQLESFELEMTALRANEPLPVGKYDTQHYRHVHHHIFQDVYRWAGKYRTVRTSKGGNPFCYPEYIEQEMNRLFATVGRSLEAENSDHFVVEAAKFLAELNAIHPFREGNGRTQLSFISMIGEQAGFPLNFSAVQRDSFLPAMIASYAGELDPLMSELSNLVE